MASRRRSSVTVPKTVRGSRSRNVTAALPTGNCCPGKPVSISCSGIMVESVPPSDGRSGSPDGGGWVLRPHDRSVHGGCGGPVLDVEVVHLGLVVEVVVRHLRVVGRGRDHDEPERRAGGRRGRPAVDVIRNRELGRDVDVRERRPGWRANGRERPPLRAAGSRYRGRLCRWSACWVVLGTLVVTRRRPSVRS